MTSKRSIGCATAKDSASRYPSARAPSGKICNVSWMTLPVQARRPSRMDRVRKFVRRNRALVGGVVGTIAALLAGTDRRPPGWRRRTVTSLCKSNDRAVC